MKQTTTKNFGNCHTTKNAGRAVSLCSTRMTGETVIQLQQLLLLRPAQMIIIVAQICSSFNGMTLASAQSQCVCYATDAYNVEGNLFHPSVSHDVDGIEF